MKIRTYTELASFESFEDRYDYLKIGGSVGAETFGYDRVFNQQFYRSAEWRSIRDLVIVRDGGCDLGVAGREIYSKILIHHMNPMTMDDLRHGNSDILDPEYLICVSHRTHNAIHYGDKNLLVTLPPERQPGDTKLW